MQNFQNITHNIIKFLTTKLFGTYKLNLLHIFNRPLLGLYEGNILYHEIHKLLLDDIFVIFDFNDIIFDKSFIQFAICKHLEDLTKDMLLERIAFINISNCNLQFIHDVIDESDVYWKNKESNECVPELIELSLADTHRLKTIKMKKTSSNK